ncbi:MAG: hypothetical protein RIB67_07965 [Miltoncostaeaceae bacterium]
MSDGTCTMVARQDYRVVRPALGAGGRQAARRGEDARAADRAENEGYPLGRTSMGYDDRASGRGEEFTMGDGDDIRYERLDYAATLTKLGDLIGREILAELRVGGRHGPFRLAAQGVLSGPPPGQAGLTGRRGEGDDIEAFMIDRGGFLAVKQEDFVEARWHAGADEGQPSAQPRLDIEFTDSVLHVAVLWRHGRSPRT